MFVGLALCLIAPTSGFAEWMLKEFCHIDIMVGAVIMNEEAELSLDRSLTVLRKVGDGRFVALAEKDSYIYGETLYVKLSDTEGQFVLDVSTKNAEFANGGCEHGQRTNKDNAALVMPSDEEEAEDVHIQGAWALGHQKVRITPTIILQPQDPSGHVPKLQLHDSTDLHEGDSDSASTGFFMIIVNGIYSLLWYIVGGLLLFVLFVLYRLQSKPGKKIFRTAKQSFD